MARQVLVSIYHVVMLMVLKVSSWIASRDVRCGQMASIIVMVINQDPLGPDAVEQELAMGWAHF